MKEPDPPDTDDDGWGDAENAASPPASAAAVDNEWDDPADLEKRVAALREQREPEVAAAEIIAPEVAAPEAAAPEVAPHAAAPEDWPGAGDAVAAEDHGLDLSTDELALPAATSDLRVAAGLRDERSSAKSGDDKKRKAAKKNSKKTSEPGHSLSARQKKFIVGGSAALVIAAVLAILGWFNSQNYYLTCGTATISAEQGRFWPWGASPLPGPAFRPIRVPSDVLCTSQEFDSRVLLEDAFLEALLKQSTALLTSGDPEHVGTAEAQLEQALLLTRGPERSAQRTLAQRLQGDVSYWRGAADTQAAAELLQRSADHFEEAAAKRPRHTSDANAWAEHARFIKLEIDKGPRSLRKDEAPKDQPHFLGLSPEQTPPGGAPDDASQTAQDSHQDAGVPAAPQPSAPPDAALPPADAALPKGGVLL